MKLTGKNGKPLLKSLRLKVFRPDGTCQNVRLTAPPHKGYSEENVDALLAEFAEKLETLFPAHEFRMVEIPPAQFNFVCRGERAAAECQQAT